MEKDDYNVANHVENISSKYEEFKEKGKYLELPFEKVALDNQFQTAKAYESFLKEKKINFTPSAFEDPREVNAVFGKVDKALTKTHPDEAKRKDEFKKIFEEIETEEAALPEDKRAKTEKAIMEKVLDRIEHPKPAAGTGGT
jgi:hypothetical protein